MALNQNIEYKVPPRIIQLSMNKSGGTILNYSLFGEASQFAPTNNQY